MKQKELAKEFGITAMEVGRLRARHVPDEDYDKDTKELTENGVDILRTVLSGNDPTAPLLIKAKVIRVCRNPRFVECLVEGVKGIQQVGIPIRISDRMRPGFEFEVQKITFKGNAFYRHSCLLRK